MSARVDSVAETAADQAAFVRTTKARYTEQGVLLMRCFKLLLAAGTLLALTVPASAITLVYEEGPNIGKAYNGPVEFKIFNFDVGTIYAPGAGPVGFGAGGGDASVAAGVATLDGLGAPPPGTAAGYATRGHGNTLEDTWGIAKITRINDPNTGEALWTPAGKGAEITVLFYGEQDFYTAPLLSGEDAIDGVGLRADFYEQPLGVSDYTGAAGTAGRSSVTDYTTVSDLPPAAPSPFGGAEGTLILQAESVPGHINPAGTLGGLATEFESRFNFSTLTGDGASYMALRDLSEGTSAYSSRDFHQFNTDGFLPLAAGYPTADISIQFDTNPTTTADWLVRSNDPLNALAVPEPVTMAGLMLGVGSLMGYVRRRRK